MAMNKLQISNSNTLSQQLGICSFSLSKGDRQVLCQLVALVVFAQCLFERIAIFVRCFHVDFCGGYSFSYNWKEQTTLFMCKDRHCYAPCYNAMMKI
jgi:hypothetical protein